MRERILQSWSGGKDSCLTLAELLSDGTWSVAALVTTVTEGYERVSMHGVRQALLREQAAALGLPLEVVYIPQNATNEIYEARMEETFARYRSLGVATIAFGDLFLADIRRYREQWLARAGIRPVFPLWMRDTRDLARRFVDEGFEAVVTCVDTRVLDRGFAGRRFDHALLADLPDTVDPCGENGEFHTFVHAGPIFREPLRIASGEVVQRESWCFCDLVPV
ncbi:MAG: diphthine--ammonia ligase [Bacillati bacterium ANGP1]|uniref:Diphthine--ammonia ligase n=1 Tax=Candidatus Segetimicrobium genomatis TaxID=2569760 RepID=A0A537J9X9_9BACT|nr:MAG: diphthine--ammonia ligase [Terrabacteria group bacterium ANGP1]